MGSVGRGVIVARERNQMAKFRYSLLAIADLEQGTSIFASQSEEESSQKALEAFSVGILGAACSPGSSQ